MRADPQRHFLLPFHPLGRFGQILLARAQWHKKQAGAFSSSNPEQEKALNWRLSKENLPGPDRRNWHPSNRPGSLVPQRHPASITAFSSLVRWTDDGRDVADTVQAMFEFPNHARLAYDCTLANSFDADYEVYYGTGRRCPHARKQGWMFKEVDSPLLGWEVYARKILFIARLVSR